MSSDKVVKLTHPQPKSKQIIFDCLRRLLKLAARREMVLCAMVMVDAHGKFHIDRIGPVNSEQMDKLLSAVEKLHEEIYTALDKGR